MLNYQNFSNWTGTSVQTQTNNGSIGANASTRALSAFMAKFLSLLFT